MERVRLAQAREIKGQGRIEKGLWVEAMRCRGLGMRCGRRLKGRATRIFQKNSYQSHATKLQALPVGTRLASVLISLQILRSRASWRKRALLSEEQLAPSRGRVVVIIYATNPHDVSSHYHHYKYLAVSSSLSIRTFPRHWLVSIKPRLFLLEYDHDA